MGGEIKSFEGREDILSSFKNLVAELKNMPEDELKAREEEIEKAEAEEIKRSRHEQFKKCGIGEKYWNCSFENFSEDSEEIIKLKQLAQRYCDETKQGKQKHLILFGNFGSGKTHMAAAILREMIASSKTTVSELPVYFTGNYTTMTDFANAYSEAAYFSKDRKSRDYIIRMATNSDICVFDEVGRMATNKMSEPDLLFQLIDSVYQHKKNLILITNLSAEEFKNLVGTAAISRLKENGNLMAFDTTKIDDHRKLRA